LVTKNIGHLLLASYLILLGVSAGFPALGTISPVLPILALLAGIFILIGK
jgi:hypothetical protein